MASSPFIFDATAENFPRLVLENSDKGPVLVNYWSPHAGPCMLLMPRLVRLCTEFGGRFLLVMLNTDEFGQLARAHGVTSIPTVKVYRHGRVVDTLHSAESETSLRTFIARHVQIAADALHAPGDIERGDPALRNLAAHVALIRAADVADSDDQLRARVANDSSDHAARLSLAGRHAIRDDYDSAMAELVELARIAPDYRDGIGRDALLALFDLLGESDERVQRVRATLNAATAP